MVPLLWNLRKTGLQTQAPCGADLEAWAKRGVLLLNASLVYATAPLEVALQRSLRSFSRAVLAHCTSLTDQPAFLIFGSKAWDLAKPILNPRV